jgi:para-aminobenzoate synthetase
VTIVVIDNYDSFTYNLYQLICTATSEEVVVIRNDVCAEWAALLRTGVDAVVVSPGPGRPECNEDFGISAEALRSGIPILGVCLGHQGLCYVEGARVEQAPEPVHGRVSRIEHDSSRLFEAVPSVFEAVRYHSLIVSDVPESLRVTAWTTLADGTRLIMAVEHRHRPAFGVQFHPESIKTAHGARLVRNFLTAAGVATLPAEAPVRPLAFRPVPAAPARSAQAWKVLCRKLGAAPDPEALFGRLFADAEHSFWLDSSSVIPGLSRFSMLGCGGRHSEYVTSVATRGVVVRQADGQVRHHPVDVFTYLERRLAQLRLPALDGLPTEFNLGYIGYLGYEMKAECGGDAVHRTDTPDAAFVLCDRAVVIDHAEQVAYALTLVPGEDTDEGERWLDRVQQAASEQVQARLVAVTDPTPSAPHRSLPTGPPVEARSQPSQYVHLIEECLAEIVAGETYEICLTTTFDTERPADSMTAYRELRKRSPVPFAAFLRFEDVEVLSASPERFLSVDTAGRVEAKPIKGTRPRGSEPLEDAKIAEELRICEKDRAENLMIVDLLRNDLGAVSEIGSVHVPVIFDVETYATVHQLVSTVRSQLRPDVSPVRCVQSAFPGGSMTGAPKRRTMQIIDRLETAGRGIYSGALGYFAFSGAVDLSIVIRTIVLAGDRAHVGAGGAIVALSDPAEEITEMQLKARAPLDALRAEAATQAAARRRVASWSPPSSSVPLTSRTSVRIRPRGRPGARRAISSRRRSLRRPLGRNRARSRSRRAPWPGRP